MKKWIAFLLAVVMIMAMTACGTAGTKNSAKPANASEETVASGSDISTSTPPASSTDTETNGQPVPSGGGAAATNG